VAASFAKANTAAAFTRAIVLGGLTAIGCGVGYAIFVGVTKMPLALITIGIAYVVAGVVRKASGGFSGRRFQVLAVVLTYLASTMGYIPGIFAGLKEGSAEQAAHPGTPSGDKQTGDNQAGDKQAASPAHEDHPPPSAGDWIKVIAILLGIMLAAPFLEVTSAPVGVLIIAFGLWEAWRRSRGVPLALEGPFRVAA
jgi:hypothetical protein